MTNIEEIIAARLANTEFVVEATSCEHLMLWEKFCKDTMFKIPFSIYTWEQLNPGWWLEIGKLCDYPVCISLIWFKINRKLIMFYETTSRVTDSEMVEEWLAKNCSPRYNDRPAHCNAMNFHHCLHFIEGR